MRRAIKVELTRLLVGRDCYHKAGFSVRVFSLAWYAEKCLYLGKMTDTGATHRGALESLEEVTGFVENHPDLKESEIAYMKRTWGEEPLTVPEKMWLETQE